MAKIPYKSPTSPSALFKDLVKMKRSRLTPRARKARRKQTKRWLYPISKERQYAKFIVSIMARFSAIAIPKIRDNLKRWIQSYKPDRADILKIDSRLDGFSDEYGQIDLELEAEFGNIFLEGATTKGNVINKAYMSQELQTLGIDTSNWNQIQWIKFVEAATGLSTALPEPWLMEVVSAWKNTNFSMIKSLSQDYIKEMNRIVHSGVMSGKPYDQVMREILEKDWNLTKYKAKFLARDQIGKLNGQMSKRRQQEAGLDLYEWSTSRDDRVRDTHDVLDGKICTFSDDTVYADTVEDALNGEWQDRSSIGAFEGIPGEDYQCRCTNLPVVTDLLDEVDSEIEETEQENDE